MSYLTALSEGAPLIKKKKGMSPGKQKNRYESSVNALAYPVPRIPPSHAKKCDARYVVLNNSSCYYYIYFIYTKLFYDNFQSVSIVLQSRWVKFAGVLYI